MQKTYENSDNIFLYKDSKVKVITIFTENGKSTALVEDENGELFEVEKSLLR